MPKRGSNFIPLVLDTRLLVVVNGKASEKKQLNATYIMSVLVEHCKDELEPEAYEELKNRYSMTVYEQKKEKEHSRYEYSFFQYDEVVRLLEQAGFSVERFVSTLFQKPGTISHEEPGRVEHMESPQSGYSAEAGFTVIMAGKGTNKTRN